MSGLLAEFDDPGALERAAEQVRAAHVGTVETLTPYAVRGNRRSVLPLLILAAGIAVTAVFFTLQWYATSVDYPVNIGGRPAFSWPAYVPMAFEFGVLGAVATGFLGFLIACRLPALHDPIDEVDGIRRASRDGYFLTVHAAGESAARRAHAVLSDARPLRMEHLP